MNLLNWTVMASYLVILFWISSETNLMICFRLPSITFLTWSESKITVSVNYESWLSVNFYELSKILEETKFWSVQFFISVMLNLSAFEVNTSSNFKIASLISWLSFENLISFFKESWTYDSSLSLNFWSYFEVAKDYMVSFTSTRSAN